MVAMEFKTGDIVFINERKLCAGWVKSHYGHVLILTKYSELNKCYYFFDTKLKREEYIAPILLRHSTILELANWRIKNDA